MLNQAQIIGHLGRDVELRYTPSGAAVCNFSIATTEKWKDKNTGEQKEATEWHRITCYERLAEVCGEWLKKGSLVYISGKIKTRKWTDKDGADKYTTEIHASEMKMLGGRPEGERQERAPASKPAAKPAQSGGGFDDMTDDVPW